MAGIGKADAERLLLGSVLCRDMPPEALEALATRVRMARYTSGDRIVRKGDPGDSMMIVVSGRVKITSLSTKGGEVLHNLIEPGQVFGEISILDGRPRSADAVAAVPTEVLVLSRALLLETLERYPKVALRLMAVLCEKVRKATELYEETVFLSLPARLFRMVQMLARQYGKPAGAGLIIEHGLSQEELGETLGVTRESVNKQFGVWKSMGLVDVSRGTLFVHSMAALAAEVDGFNF